MITIHWVLRLSPGWNADDYDEWYLGQHTNYGKNSPNIVRYCVNRALSEQPRQARGAVFRVAEECWDSFEEAEASWNAPLGHAVLGDAVANLGLLDANALPGMAVTEDRCLDVARPAIFNTLKRGYTSSEDGTIVKFLAFGMSENGPQIADWYCETYADLGQDQRLRQHICGKSIGRKLQVGRLLTIPGEEGQLLYDWALEFWFGNVAEAHDFLNDVPFLAMWQAIEERCSDISASLYRGQEMLIAANPAHHHDDDV